MHNQPQSFSGIAQGRWPEFQFSSLRSHHVSFYRAVQWPNARSPKAMALAYQVAGDFGQQLFEFLDISFPGTIWLIKGTDLQALLLNDVLNLWEDGHTVETMNRIQNPRTGNYFHRIGLNEGVAFGVRVWVYQSSTPRVSFRARLEPQDESEVSSRMKLQQPVTDAINRYGEIVNELGEDLLAGLQERARKYVSTALAGNQDTTGLTPPLP